MKATKDWGPCGCDCGKTIASGDEMVMVDGALYLAGHENNRRTRIMPAVKREEMEKERKKGRKDQYGSSNTSPSTTR
jgi:hypothetical protein